MDVVNNPDGSVTYNNVNNPDAINAFKQLQAQSNNSQNQEPDKKDDKDKDKDKQKKQDNKDDKKDKDDDDDPISSKISRYTNYAAAGTIVIGLGPEDPAADVIAGGEELVGQTGAGLFKLGELAVDLWNYTTNFSAEHTKGARPSTKGKHQKGQSRRGKDRGGEKGEKKPPRIKPPNWKGPWPPKS